MAVYSYSQLSTYEGCPLKYKLNYIDRIKRYTEGIEAFLGNRVHETLQKCYDDARFTRINTLEELLAHYNIIWQQSWHDDIVIVKKDLSSEHYKALGKKMLESYYRRYFPFDADITIDTEKRLSFSLDAEKKYKMRGVIDRLSVTPGGVYLIHDYKTSAHLPDQSEADKDKQLALYQLAVSQLWPGSGEIKLVWHYLAFDRELVSSRTEEAMKILVQDTRKLIDEIESASDFPPVESALCDWCEYPDLCPKRKHQFLVGKLPKEAFLQEPGVILVNKLAELKEQAAVIEDEIDKVREAIINYARINKVVAIKGEKDIARVNIYQKLKFPGKNDPEREALDNIILAAGKWPEVSTLDTSALATVIQRKAWDQNIIQTVLRFGKIEEATMVSLSKIKADI